MVILPFGIVVVLIATTTTTTTIQSLQTVVVLPPQRPHWRWSLSPPPPQRTTCSFVRNTGRHSRSDSMLNGRRTGDSEEDDIEYINSIYESSSSSSIIDEIRNFDPSLILQNERNEDDDAIDETDVLDEMEFLRNELVHLESLEDLIQELEKYSQNDESFDIEEGYNLDDDDDDDDDDDVELSFLWNEESLDELLNNLPPTEEGNDMQSLTRRTGSGPTTNSQQFYQNLERVLLQGVVPVQADVGSDCLVGDFGFDPLHFSDRDLFRPAQTFLLQLLPSSSSITTTTEANNIRDKDTPQRPRALILRDYREAEIRHGRLAMLAAMIWPLQEMVDKFILSEEQYGPLLYGPVTLPYFPLFMTAIMLLLGYLDIYSQAIKDMDQIGDAFLPGDCFWDPLQVLQGAPDKMRRNMQERELFNGRAAMIAIAAYILEESITHKALIDIGTNALLLQPAYEIPFIQEWLDEQFSLSSPLTETGADPTTILDSIDTLDALVQSTMILIQSFLL